MVDKLALIGFTLIILGFLLIIAGSIIASSNPQVSGAFLIVFFFIPIAGSFGEYGHLLLILLIILAIFLIVMNLLFFLFGRRSQPSTSLIPPS